MTCCVLGSVSPTFTIVWDLIPANDLPTTSAEVEGYFEHLQTTLEACGYLDPEQPGLIMQRLRRLYLRSELNILRGMLTAIEKQRS